MGKTVVPNRVLGMVLAEGFFTDCSVPTTRRSGIVAVRRSAVVFNKVAVKSCNLGMFPANGMNHDGAMRLNENGFELVKQFEGLRLVAYSDSGGVLTIGWGHTGRDVKPGMRISPERADELLWEDLGVAERGVRRHLKATVNSNQFSALVSFAYNLGVRGASRTDVLKHVNAGRFGQAARAFDKYVHVKKDGRKIRLAGLVRRRAEERKLFETPEVDPHIVPAPSSQTDLGEDENYYVVKSGDTLSQLSQRSGMTIDELLSWNPHISDPNLIYPGDVIRFTRVAPQGASVDLDTLREAEAAWYVVAKAEIGVTEKKGRPRNNLRILQYHQSTTLSGRAAREDETPWCSSFVNWCMDRVGIKGTRSAMARSWLKWGTSIQEPREGCIVVFSRPKGGPSAGHVGFYVGRSAEKIRVLGGNQSNSVSITSYSKQRVLGYRWPKTQPDPSKPVTSAPSTKAEPDTKPANTYYVVQTGDTLGAIAERSGFKINQLLAWNPHIQNPNKIFAGDVIMLAGDVNVAPRVEPSFETGMPWFEIAQREMSTREYRGSIRNNPRILEYHRSTTLPESMARLDETPWCSSFVNWCVMRAGVKGTRSAMARSWLKWGKRIREPRKGCIVVFSRPRGGPNAGHVGFYAGETGKSIKLLGGNQSNAVSIASYPKSRVLGYRWPSGVGLSEGPNQANRRKTLIPVLELLKPIFGGLFRSRRRSARR